MREFQLERRVADVPADELHRTFGIPQDRRALPEERKCPTCGMRHRSLICPICKEAHK